MDVTRLWPDGPLYRQEEGLFPLSSDTAWLGAFTSLGRVRRVCDLGCGGGALSLQLLGRRPELEVLAVDILPQAAVRTAENAALNGWKLETLCADLREYRALLPREEYDLVVSNPPYYAASGGVAEGSRGLARQESCPPEELCRAAAWLLRYGGRFSLIYPPERLSELFCALTAAGLEPKRLQLVMKNTDTPPCAALVEARKGGGKGLSIEPPLLTEERK